MRKIKSTDLYSFNFLSDLSVSPDGRHLVFMQHRANEKKNGYDSFIWLMDTETEKCSQMTFGGLDSAAKWLDSETIYFRRSSGQKPGSSCWYTLSIKGGEAEKLVEINEKVISLDALSDGRFVGILTKHSEGKEEKADDEAMDGRDLYVFDEVYFWFNGQGIRNKLRNSLAMFDKDGKAETLTPQYFNTSAYALSPCRRYVAYTGVEYKDKVSTKSGLFLYDIEKGETKTLYAPGQNSVGAIAFAGRKIFAAINDGEYSGKNSRYFLFDIESGEKEELPFVDAEVGGAAGSDSNLGGGIVKKFYDGKMYMTRAVGSSGNLCAMDMEGAHEDRAVSKKVGSINCFDISGGTVYMIAMRDMSLCEVYSLDIATGKEEKLTGFNAGYMAENEVIHPEYFVFKNSDGVELEGFVIKPRGFKKGKKYPGVLEIHGGPKTIFGGVFHHEMQILANKGFFVFYTNPRGSDGRGEKFAYSTRFLGTKDYDDLMEFTDKVIEKYPELDEKRIGICGGSYGGFMCNWMIGHTDRFAAAASQRSISNYVCKLTVTDIGTTYDLQQVGADPWEDFETVWETSPLKYAHNAKTPTLFIQSDEDYRCWMSGALQMFSALKMNGTDARVVLFHGENHELSRSGRPHNRITRLDEIAGWFEKYLK